MIGQTTTLTITTQEGVSFSLPLAGPVVRGLAWMTDAAFIAGGFYLLSQVVEILRILSPDWAVFFYLFMMLAVTLGYSIVFEWLWNGRTPGKRLLKLRVVDERGRPLTLSQIVLRNVMRAIDAPVPFCYIIGGTTMLFTKHCQRLGDLAAGTVVVRTPQVAEPRLDALLSGPYNSFRDAPVAEARLRQTTSPDEAYAVLSAMIRRDQLAPEARLQVFRQMADHFRAKSPFPEEITASLSDEQYLRNVAESLFRRKASS